MMMWDGKKHEKPSHMSADIPQPESLIKGNLNQIDSFTFKFGRHVAIAMLHDIAEYLLHIGKIQLCGPAHIESIPGVGTEPRHTVIVRD
jgi:hypothetical protein